MGCCCFVHVWEMPNALLHGEKSERIGCAPDCHYFMDVHALFGRLLEIKKSKRCFIHIIFLILLFSMSAESGDPMHSMRVSIRGVSMFSSITSSISDPRFRFRWRAITVVTLLALAILMYLHQSSSSSTDSKVRSQRSWRTSRDVSGAEVDHLSFTLKYNILSGNL